ncbi:MAG: LemA family protein [archaeon]
MIEWVIAGIILFIIVVLVLIIVYYYNRIRVLKNRIDNAWSQIDVQLKKRAELVPNLVEIVQSYMKHEQKAIKLVTESRKALLSAKTVENKNQAGDLLGGALKSLFALAENYPQLRASENFGKLQEELTTIEDKIAYSRQFYNDSVLTFNNLVTTIPGKWFAGSMKEKTNPYLETSEEQRKPVKVKFNV